MKHHLCLFVVTACISAVPYTSIASPRLDPMQQQLQGQWKSNLSNSSDGVATMQHTLSFEETGYAVVWETTLSLKDPKNLTAQESTYPFYRAIGHWELKEDGVIFLHFSTEEVPFDGDIDITEEEEEESVLLITDIIEFLSDTKFVQRGFDHESAWVTELTLDRKTLRFGSSDDLVFLKVPSSDDGPETTAVQQSSWGAVKGIVK